MYFWVGVVGAEFQPFFPTSSTSCFQISLRLPLGLCTHTQIKFWYTRLIVPGSYECTITKSTGVWERITYLQCSFTHIHVHTQTYTHKYSLFCSKKAEQKCFSIPSCFHPELPADWIKPWKEKVRCELHSVTCQGHFNSTANCLPNCVFFSKILFPVSTLSALLRFVMVLFCMCEKCECSLFKDTFAVTAVCRAQLNVPKERIFFLISYFLI